MEIRRLGHSSFKILGSGLAIYIDPHGIKESDKADLILITHEHHDHCSADDIEKIVQHDTLIVCPRSCFISGNTRLMSPGDSIVEKGIGIEAVAAYNIGKPFHPKARGDLGYIISVEGKKVYHAGDTDLIPEMKKVTCDICLLPVSGAYVMNPQEAAEAADLINPTLVAMPMHYGSGIVGTDKDAEAFAKNSSVKVVFDIYRC